MFNALSRPKLEYPEELSGRSTRWNMDMFSLSLFLSLSLCLSLSLSIPLSQYIYMYIYIYTSIVQKVVRLIQILDLSNTIVWASSAQKSKLVFLVL